MKKILIALFLAAVTLPTLAQHYNHYNHYRYHNHRVYHHGSGTHWVAPLIIGGIVGAAIAHRPVQTDTVIVQPQPIYVPQESCTLWREVQTPDGRIYRERTCTQ